MRKIAPRYVRRSARPPATRTRRAGCGRQDMSTVREKGRVWRIHANAPTKLTVVSLGQQTAFEGDFTRGAVLSNLDDFDMVITGAKINF